MTGVLRRFLKRLPGSGYHLRAFIVVWLDLLGQGKKLEQLYIPRSAAEREEVVKIAKETFGHLHWFRKGVRNVQKEMSKPLRYSKATRQRLTKNQFAILNKYNLVEVESRFLADSAILSINLYGTAARPPLRSIESMLDQLAANMVLFLSLGIPIRGAIAAGICDELKTGELYGQALSRAHKCETEAGYPRIVIHPSFIKYLNSMDYSVFPEDERQYCKGMVTHIQEVIIRDTDQKPIFSYLAPVFMETLRRANNGQDLLQKACVFIAKEIERLQVVGDLPLRDRYLKLKAYFESQGQWTAPAR